MIKKWQWLLVAMVVSLTVGLMQCGETDKNDNDNDKDAAALGKIEDEMSGATGSCKGLVGYGDGEDAIPVTICVEYKNWAEKEDGENKKNCTTTTKEDSMFEFTSGTWADTGCSKTDKTSATCLGVVNEHGGTMDVYAESAIYNAVLEKHLCTAAMKGTYKKYIDPVTVSAAVDIKQGSAKVACYQMKGIPEEMFEQVQKSMEEAGTLEKGKSCSTSTANNSCLGIKEEGNPIEQDI